MNRDYFTVLLVGLTLFLAACGKKTSHEKEHGEHGENENAHSHVEGESPTGASFKPGKGIILTDETRKILNVQIAEIKDQTIDRTLPLNVQIFGESHHHVGVDTDHTGCDVHGSGLIANDAVDAVKKGLLVRVQSRDSASLTGAVLAIQKGLARGETEVVVGITNGAQALKAGEFVQASILLPKTSPVATIPKSAVLRTSAGAFAYVVNGNAYLKTAIKIGAVGEQLVEILGGLLAGNEVVTNPVETLWLIELRATKGGGHSH